MGQRYRDIGVATVFPDNDGARAIIEHIDSDPNALEVAQSVRDNGYHGCWVLMVGTNDAANIAAGANILASLLAIMVLKPWRKVVVAKSTAAA